MKEEGRACMKGSKKERLDVVLVDKNLAATREKAKKMIMAGLVFVNEQRIDKPGTRIDTDLAIEIKGNPNPYVSRGGLKLEKALDLFDFPVKGLNFLDIGASTGGFTDCLLKNGAEKVYAIDVGYGQLAWELRQDKRVIVMERTNIRNLNKAQIKDPIDGAVIDVSFISLKLVLPVIKDIIRNKANIIALVKPQFEVGKGKVGKKGVVRDENLHIEVLISMLTFAESMGLTPVNLDFSPITGPEGNIEFLLHLYKGILEDHIITDSKVNETVKKAHSLLR